MDRGDFETLLDRVVAQLNEEVRKDQKYHGADAFQARVMDVLKQHAQGTDIAVSLSFHPHAFPDISANGFGVEVKTVKKDSWLSVGNSVFEGMRDHSCKHIYVVFGKFAGWPEVRWGRYEEKITHVRISHAPRFVIEMDRDSSLFGKMNVPYDQFSQLSADEKMGHIRKYSRGRLKEGERLWWLEDEHEDEGLPVEVRMYRHLPDHEKIKLRAEGAILCPEICQHGRVKGKYDEVTVYLMTRYGVFAPQSRDLYSAGSVAGPQRGGNYLQRALVHIESAMREAAAYLSDDLIMEYWKVNITAGIPRLRWWLDKADGYARDWKPSDYLFTDLKTPSADPSEPQPPS